MTEKQYTTEEEAEKKNKRRGLVFAIFLHVIFIILGLLNMITAGTPPEEIKGIQVVEAIPEPEPKVEPIPEPEPEPIPEPDDLAFEDSGSSDPDDPIGETEDPKPQEAAPETPKPEPVPEPTPPAPPTPEPVPEPVPEPAPKPTPPTPTPPAPPVQTTPEPTPIKVPPAPKPTKPIPPKPTPSAPKPSTKPSKPSPPKDNTTKPTKPSKPKPSSKPNKPGNGSDANTSTGTGKEDGKPGRPDGTDNGTKPGNGGNGGKDNGTGMGDGDGYGFARTVINRPNLNQIKGMAMGKKGRIYLDICLNKDGKVIKAKADKSKSSIKDSQVLKRAEKLIKRYQYNADSKAPKKHCHHFVFRIKEDKASSARRIPKSYNSFEEIIKLD